MPDERSDSSPSVDADSPYGNAESAEREHWANVHAEREYERAELRRELKLEDRPSWMDRQ
jgi:hypothetical protein